MVVRNGVETKNVTSKDFDLTSASASRVLLPCRAWGEMRLEMMNAALGMMSEEELHRVCDAPYEEVVRREDVKMLFNIQRKHCRLLRPFKFRGAFFIDDLLQAFVFHALYEQIRIKKIL